MNVATDLTGKKIAVLAADGFEFIELAVPVAALRAVGAHVDIVSLHAGRIRGMNLTLPTATVAVDRTLDEVQPEDYDALFIPGGFVNPDILRQSARVRSFVAGFDAAQKPIASICHGPWVLVSANRVAGRALASWPSLRDDIINAGGIWRDEAVVRDRNWISSRGPHDLAEFVPAMMDLISRPEALEDTETSTSSAPALEPVTLEVSAARWLPGPAIWGLLGAAFGAGTYAIVAGVAQRHGGTAVDARSNATREDNASRGRSIRQVEHARPS